MYPMSVVLIERVFLKQRNTNLLTWIGMLIGLTGVVFLIGQIGMHAPFSWQLFWGLMASVFAMLSWSVGSIFLARKQTGLNPYHAMGWQMLIGCVLTSLIVKLTGDYVPLTQIKLESWLQIGYLVLVGSVLAFIAFLYSLKTLPATLSSLYAYVNPVVASLVAAWVLNEPLTSSILIGTLFTLAGVFIVSRSVKKMG
jgi:drug/metabolite transporter (DMT)-like permease